MNRVIDYVKYGGGGDDDNNDGDCDDDNTHDDDNDDDKKNDVDEEGDGELFWLWEFNCRKLVLYTVGALAIYYNNYIYK